MTTRVLGHVGRAPRTAAGAHVGQRAGPGGPARTRRPPHKRRGSALLAVLWLSAALSAIAFSVANTVRAETERTSTEVDALRSYFLAVGAVDRAILWIQWGPSYRNPDGTPKYYQNPMPALQFIKVLDAVTTGLLFTYFQTPRLIHEEDFVAAFEALAPSHVVR